ncbi:hypothetical protein [Stenotrophomonas maltophilia]|uniref:hypothetical protein n=1 Tax=Stenotrophomonas maltophilia TaxID=40324 RepID=UPI001661358F|nr:hypothetical protein [Stenotrophomonas maltophilia]MBN4958123.1 hypothetical protein [Stenotrophomonas maltophilia]MBN4967824.1 hypothetical protein [Stenotrophomonas maltophilia]
MELEAKRVVFFSQQDERFFFEWIGRIGCIGNVVGRGDVIYLSLDPDAVLEEDVWELAALFRRYRIPLAQLRTLEAGRYSRALRDAFRE